MHTRIFLLLLLSCWATGNAAAVAEARPPARYRITPDAGLRELAVQACFADGLPARLEAGNWRAARYLRGLRVPLEDGHASPEPERNRLYLPARRTGECLTYRVDLQALTEDIRGFNSGLRTAGSVVLSTALWLWLPAGTDAGRPVDLVFHLPPGMQVSAPGTPLDGERPGYRLAATPNGWPGAIALGRFTRQTLRANGSRFHVALLDGPSQVAAEPVLRWLQQAARETAQLDGGLPAEHVQLLVVPMERGRDSAPFATTARGGGSAVHIAFNARASDTVLHGDWVAIHELAHLYLPFVAREDAWLSEGFASYYQNILRARAGRITAHRAWQELQAGLARGRRNTDPRLSLRAASRCMFRCDQVMRTYWSGVAFWLRADVALRRQSGGRQSLDTVLDGFMRCCRYPDRRWEAEELLARLDRIAGTRLFLPLYGEMAGAHRFPDTEALLHELGVIGAGGAGVLLDDTAPAAPVRAALTAPRQPGASAAEASEMPRGDQ